MGFLRRMSLAALSTAQLTYPEHGATRGPLPAGYGHLHREVILGAGGAAFERAAAALFGWQMHRAAGLNVVASGPAATTGTVVVLSPPCLRWVVRVPCRVVYTVNEPDRQGYGYGTLPGHPERGEEAFLVEILPDEEVRLTVRAFSKPASPLTRAAGPLGRRAQDLVTDRYVAALRRLTQP